LPQNVIELNVVDFIGGLRLEAFPNQGELLFGHMELLVVEDGLEASVGDEATAALVLVLEEGLN